MQKFTVYLPYLSTDIPSPSTAIAGVGTSPFPKRTGGKQREIRKKRLGSAAYLCFECLKQKLLSVTYCRISQQNLAPEAEADKVNQLYLFKAKKKLRLQHVCF